MNKHTPEPWYVVNGNKIYRRPEIDIYEYSGNEGAGIAGDKAIVICDKGWYGKNEASFPADANASRIVACVNACAGMENPAEELAQLRADKARLIEALRITTRLVTYQGVIDENEQLLAKMEGK